MFKDTIKSSIEKVTETGYKMGEDFRLVEKEELEGIESSGNMFKRATT